MRESAYREINGADSGGQPCSAAFQSLLYHSNNGNTCLIRSAIPFSVDQFHTFWSCPECCLPLNGFPHKRCEGSYAQG